MPQRGALVSRGEYISHFNLVRMRVVGEGDLELTYYSLDDEESQELEPIVMQDATNRQRDRLANFRQQRAALEFRTTEFGDYLKINRILLFHRRSSTSYPG